jgi:hypothetical protein
LTENAYPSPFSSEAEASAEVSGDAVKEEPVTAGAGAGAGAAGAGATTAGDRLQGASSHASEAEMSANVTTEAEVLPKKRTRSAVVGILGFDKNEKVVKRVRDLVRLLR